MEAQPHFVCNLHVHFSIPFHDSYKLTPSLPFFHRFHEHATFIRRPAQSRPRAYLPASRLDPFWRGRDERGKVDAEDGFDVSEGDGVGLRVEFVYVCCMYRDFGAVGE